MSFWIFKCNPERYRLAERLSDPNPVTTWLVSRYKKEIAPGDTVFVVETGPKRSIRATLRVDERPKDIQELDHEQEYWVGADTKTRCMVRCTIVNRTQLFLEGLAQTEGLKNLSVFHGVQRGTNFRVTDEEGEILLSLLRDKQTA